MNAAPSTLIELLREQGFRCRPSRDGVFVYAHAEHRLFTPVSVSAQIKHYEEGQVGRMVSASDRVFGATEARSDIAEDIRRSSANPKALWIEICLPEHDTPFLAHAVIAPAGASASELRSIILEV
jgi:hypothetical protein